MTNPADAFIAALDSSAQRHDVVFDGSHITWRRFGAGPALVLLHGGHGSWLHWARNIGAWCTGRSVWVPDLPGYGDSSPPAEPSLAALVDATTRTLDTLVGSSTPIALVGFSFGGLVAANLAARRPGVAQLALLGPAGHGSARRPRGDLRAWRDAADSHDEAALAEVMRHNLAMHMLHGADAIDALALRIHTSACLKTRFHSKAISRAGGLAQALERHHGPLLLAWGEHDVTVVPERVAASLGQGRASCRTRLVPGAGHWVQYEAAEAINQLLLGWLDDPVIVDKDEHQAHAGPPRADPADAAHAAPDGRTGLSGGM
jgi:pimeloyl-ACP methyl ester carboxylesterase